MLFIDADQEKDGFFWVRSFDRKQSGTPDHDVLGGYTGFFEFEGETQTDFFVGSGELRLMPHQNAEQMVNAFSRQREVCVIPGSSWKGAFRTQVELFTPSCFTDRNQQCACPACSLFGKLGYRGRVSIEDSRIREVETFCKEIVQRNKPERDRPLGEEAIYRKLYNRDFTVNQAAQSSEWEYLEALSAGTKLLIRLRFQNLVRWEMGLLLFALGVSEWHPFDFKVGGAKNRGMGVIRLSWKQGTAEESVDWLFKEGRRWAMPLAERTDLIQEFLNKVEENRLLHEVIQIAERLKKEYRRDA